MTGQEESIQPMSSTMIQEDPKASSLLHPMSSTTSLDETNSATEEPTSTHSIFTPTPLHPATAGSHSGITPSTPNTLLDVKMTGLGLKAVNLLDHPDIQYPSDSDHNDFEPGTHDLNSLPSMSLIDLSTPPGQNLNPPLMPGSTNLSSTTLSTSYKPEQAEMELFHRSEPLLIQGAQDSLLGQSHTDCILVSMEGVPITVNKLILSPCTTLKNIFLENACCQGQCQHQGILPTPVLIPNLPFRHLSICINFLYKGIICYKSMEKKTIYEALKNILGIKRSVKVTTWEETSLPSTSHHSFTPPSPKTPPNLNTKMTEQFHSFKASISRTSISTNETR